MAQVTVTVETGTEVLVYEAGSATDPIKILTDQVAQLISEKQALQDKIDAAKLALG